MTTSGVCSHSDLGYIGCDRRVTACVVFIYVLLSDWVLQLCFIEFILYLTHSWFSFDCQIAGGFWVGPLPVIILEFLFGLASSDVASQVGLFF